MANITNETLSKANGSLPELKNKSSSVGMPLEEISREAGQKIGSMASSFADSATKYAKASQSYVKENPAKGIAIATAAGVLLGSVLTLALRRRE